MLPAGCLWDIDAGSVQQLHMALAACVQESLEQQGNVLTIC